MSKKEDLEKKKKIAALKQRREEAMKEAGARAARTISKTTEQRDGENEEQDWRRYKEVGPIKSQGIFTVATPKKADNNLTQAELDRKRKR